MEAEDGVWTCEMATFVSECVEDFNIGGYIYIMCLCGLRLVATCPPRCLHAHTNEIHVHAKVFVYNCLLHYVTVSTVVVGTSGVLGQ